MEEVWAAADTVLGLGERPTIERVRQQLGRGSPNTVAPMLDGWYGSLAKRLQTPGDAGEGLQDSGEQLPGPVLRAAKTLWGRAVQYAHDAATAQLAQAQAELDGRTKALSQAQQELQLQQQRIQDRSEAYAVAMQAKDAQISELSGQAKELHAQLLACQKLLDDARTEAVQLRDAADLQRQHQEIKDAERRAECLRHEDRGQAQERRLNGEIDRARQESKRLASQLEADNRKSASALAEVTEKMGSLDAQVGALRAEKTSLLKELQLAREETTTWKAKFDDRSNDMFAVLKELRDRLPSSPAVVRKARKTRNKR